MKTASMSCATISSSFNVYVIAVLEEEKEG